MKKNKFAGIGLVFGLIIGASISSIGPGAGLVVGMLVGASIDLVNKKKINQLIGKLTKGRGS